jgi:DNA repair ATPase RecN
MKDNMTCQECKKPFIECQCKAEGSNMIPLHDMCRKHNQEYTDISTCSKCDQERANALRDATKEYSDLLKKYNDLQQTHKKALDMLSDMDLAKLNG